MPSLEAAEHPTEVPVTRRALPASRALIAVVTLAIVVLLANSSRAQAPKELACLSQAKSACRSWFVGIG